MRVVAKRRCDGILFDEALCAVPPHRGSLIGSDVRALTLTTVRVIWGSVRRPLSCCEDYARVPVADTP